MTRFLRAVLFMFLLVAIAAGCESKPPPGATKSLTAAMQALKDKKIPEFVKRVLPDQRGTIDYGSDVTSNKIRKAPLAQLMTMEYFSTVESFEVSKEGDSDQTETSTSIAVTFSYKDNAVGTFFVVMKKEGGSWLIDMKSSVEREYRSNGASAFSTLKFE
jgi:hypothetical protein